MNYDRQDVQVGVIVENCGLHIGAVTMIDHKDGSMKIRSLFDGKEYGCDVYHCGIEVQTPEQIVDKLNLYRTGGMDAIGNDYDLRCKRSDAKLHPEFKPETFYWVESDLGGFSPFYLNHQMGWRIGNGMYVSHDAFIEMVKKSRIVEAVPPGKLVPYELKEV